ncbi:MAG: hypothetical protein ACI9SC_001339 [Gammaproteobacteria bacterium]|jgi:hypothetical protein
MQNYARNKLPTTILSLYILINISACTDQITYKDTGNESQLVSENELPEVKFCKVPDPKVPSSAFDIYHSNSDEYSGYWVNYQCKQSCEDWKQCQVPAYSEDKGALIPDGRNPELSKQALAFVVDGMAGHLTLSNDGNKTVFIHTGAGGTRYYIKPADTLEKMSLAKTVMIRWEKGYTSPIVQTPFTNPITWGWYSRTSAEATNIKELNKRVASLIAWSHDNLSDSNKFGTLGCSMGTNATFGPVLWHGLDPIIDYQVFVGGPNMWDLNAQCARRHYKKGYCDLDGVTNCSRDDDCLSLDKTAHCVKPGPYTTIDLLFNQLPNHIHATNACDIRASDPSTKPYPPFDESSMGFASGADWEIDHQMDFLVNLGAKQGGNYTELGSDKYWGLGHFPYVFNKIEPDENKHWHSIPESHHCDGMYKEALDLIKERMAL